MSLNWKEIDLVLSELDIVGSRIERVSQPSYDTITLSLYKPGAATELLISAAQGACRIHRASSPPPKGARPLRFQECLKSRILGGRIESVRQLGRERVVRMDIAAQEGAAAARDDTVYKAIGPGARKIQARRADEGGDRAYRLYARLWSGAANVILAGDDGVIVDVLARRPKRGELSGEPLRLEEELATRPAPEGREFAVRDLPGSGSFNERIEAAYARAGGELSLERLLEAARDRFGRKRRALEARAAEFEARAAEFRGAERLREIGDILMANQGSPYEGRFLGAEDFFRGGRLDIEIDPALSVVENARAYYERHKKARSGLADVVSELESARAGIARLAAELAALEATEDPLLIARALSKGGASPERAKRELPGLSLEVSGWTILIGRSAKENDELLRRHVRGSDVWLHARDWPGSYVFVKARAGKTVPLEILLDAGMLAIYYSKGRSNGGGDLYYTYAKYLRRAKDAPRGTVLPSQEKNLSVRIDEARLKELRGLMGGEGEVS
jgi:predicted ribosome quality control (RQC) complex YloA/Tae2 family protein